MPHKKYLVTLTPAERDWLTGLASAGKHSALTITRARILLKADQAEGGPAWEDQDIAQALDCSVRTVERVRQRFVERGPEQALGRKPQSRPSRQRKFDGAAEARLIALACAAPPEGRARWTMKLLADKLVELGVFDSVSDETVRRVLKNDLKPHLKEQWVIPPGQSGEFVARMEDVLEVYRRPYDAKRPLVCLDEVPVQLVGETRVPLPAAPGRPARYDSEYVRNGTANLFMIFEPLLGWPAAQVTERRTAKDFAEVLRWLAEEVHPEARRLVLVTDNLNTHGPGCLYEALEPARARRIAERLEWHYTPRHGSWLNMAEIELAALSKQCLGRQIESAERLAREVAAWEYERNEQQVSVNWQFTTAKARIKLRRLYPTAH
jgi:hypothetical protein